MSGVSPVSAVIERFYARTDGDPLAGAFQKKAAVHAGMQMPNLDVTKFQEVFRALMARPRSGKSAAYISIPFCKTRCLYCGFFNRFHRDDLEAAYVDALIGELKQSSSDPAVTSGPVHALYLGGGTPNALSAENLRRVLDAATCYLPLANDCEITVEGRIHGFGQDKIDACLEGGANRFSIGVQSFDTNVRRSMARIDDRESVLQALERLMATDQAAVVIDLVYGFPGQTMEIWEEDVRTAASLALDGADLYQLNVLPHSELAKRMAQGAIEPAADMTRQARMFAQGLDVMEANRWRRLSVSHWGRTTRERNLYNQLVKNKAHILAFGCGAGGSLHGHGYFVERDLERYLDSIREGRKPLAMVTARPDTDREVTGAITGGFDVAALNLQQLAALLGTELLERCLPLFEQWGKAGLLEQSGHWVVLARAGQFWNVTMAQYLLEYLASLREPTMPAAMGQ
ncbi:heme anaerobic degradation radical SAM methyltransferase ChuW/HutW [Desulfurispirillum indicum]|uniref:heme anaerobic degradation radical SAM methyltransferase ChuW/HutW n=1 Tax=Desulfurispirillum indicum TaxID=936456 RepID=UPI001CFAB693|nr:heme anaerobic degradation radical SAM methyltransferase ChuW/HutW [Desulfurispirillum indicum]UCZ56067.1 heme anaerobic degradation radical SAM methyltransferase ChuW/HutW [Desulfurispirillum indicum]